MDLFYRPPSADELTRAEEFVSHCETVTGALIALRDAVREGLGSLRDHPEYAALLASLSVAAHTVADAERELLADGEELDPEPLEACIP